MLADCYQRNAPSPVNNILSSVFLQRRKTAKAPRKIHVPCQPTTCPLPYRILGIVPDLTLPYSVPFFSLSFVLSAPCWQIRCIVRSKPRVPGRSALASHPVMSRSWRPGIHFDLQHMSFYIRPWCLHFLFLLFFWPTRIIGKLA